MDFIDKLNNSQNKNNSLLCVGLDPDIKHIKISQFEFNKRIIDKTAKYVSCYKTQVAFYSAAGMQGLKNLHRTIAYTRKNYPQIPIICDAKRGDTETTNEQYAREVFDWLKADAVTINPYMGFDSLAPFLERKDKGIIILCRTSNPGAVDFQDLPVANEKLYIVVAKKIVEWSKKYPNLLMVIGSTWPSEIKKIRQIAPKITFLVPGIGAQGGDLKNTLLNGLRRDNKGLIISSSRGIIYAQDPARAASDLRDEINSYR